MLLGRPERTVGEVDGCLRGQALPRNAQPTVIVQFARKVADALDGPILRYSNRLELLRLSDKLGIGRFQAHLIIAAVQHAAEAREQHRPAPIGKWLSPVALALSIEGLLLMGAWRALCA